MDNALYPSVKHADVWKANKQKPQSNKENVGDQYKVISCSAGKIGYLCSFAEMQKLAQIAQVLD